MWAMTRAQAARRIIATRWLTAAGLKHPYMETHTLRTPKTACMQGNEDFRRAPVFIGDQTDREFLSKVVADHGPFRRRAQSLSLQTRRTICTLATSIS